MYPKLIAFSMCVKSTFKPVFICELIISPSNVSATVVETVTNSVQCEINKRRFQLGEILGPGLFVLKIKSEHWFSSGEEYFCLYCPHQKQSVNNQLIKS